MLTERQETSFITTKRFEALVDAIFGVAMTILVLSFSIPFFTELPSNQALLNSLAQMSHQFVIYIFAFVLLATFWYHHHEFFSIIKKADYAFFWINVFWLMLIAIVPFSVSLTSGFGPFELSAIIFHTNMLIISLLSYLSITYAIRKGFTLSRRRAKKIQIACLSLPCAAIVAIALAFFTPRFSYLAYFLVFGFDYLIPRILPKGK